MKLYKVCFFTLRGGERVSHYPYVAVQKIPGKAAYMVKWEFSLPLMDEANKSKVVPAKDEIDAIRSFTVGEIDWCEVEFVSFLKLKM